MAWENCVNNIRATLDPNAKEVKDVNWRKDVTQHNLEYDTFRSADPFALVCPDRHCTDYADFSIQAHRICNCQDINGKKIPDCEPKDNLYPYPANVCLDINNPSNYDSTSGRACTKKGDNFYPLTCHCCCSCFAYGTKIGILNGTKKIEQFQIGDPVMTADVTCCSGKVQLDWILLNINFSSGTGPNSHQSAMVYVQHGETGTTIVTPDHIFLMSDGKLKRADRLVPGVDFLVSPEGKPVPINEVSVGEYEGGVHHIATEQAFDGNVNRHLLISDGVVSGDFNLQIHADELMKQGYFAQGHDKMPKIGSQRYNKEYANKLHTGIYQTFQSKGLLKSNIVKKMEAGRKFYVYGERSIVPPRKAAAYFTHQQAADIAENSGMRDFTELNIGSAAAKYLINLFGGFYPNIHFYYDIGNLEPNAYGFTQYGKNTVVITGGLTRLKELRMEGLALIISHMITRIQKSEPLDALGFTSVAMADYYSILPMQTAFFEQIYSDTFKKGMKQLENNVFKYITKENENYVGDPYEPTVETRLDSLDAGFAMVYPPLGIGGPEERGLKLLHAKATVAQFSDSSFTMGDITAEQSQCIFKQLMKHRIINEEGYRIQNVTIETELSFLFDTKETQLQMTENEKRYMTEEVRYVLIHKPSILQLTFNQRISTLSGVNAGNYSLSPECTVKNVQLDAVDEAIVYLEAVIQGDTSYMVIISKYLMSDNGSTLDPENNSKEVKLTYAS